MGTGWAISEDSPLRFEGDVSPSKPGLTLIFPSSFALLVLIAEASGRELPHPTFPRSLQSLCPRCVVTIRRTLMRCEGPGRAGCTQTVGYSACISMYIHVCIAPMAWNQTAQGFRRPAESASDPLLHSSWSYVTGTNHNIFLFFLCMIDLF